MTSEWLEGHKPAAPARIHLLLAGAMWSAVGTALLTVGFRWSLHVPTLLVGLLLAVAVAAGVAKSRFLLDRAARRIADRITARGDGRCVGGFLSLPSWSLVVAMVAAGRFLRSGVLATRLVGLLYAGVGTALLLSSRLLWQAWQRARRPANAKNRP